MMAHTLIADVQKMVARFYGMSTEEMLSDDRDRMFAHPRQVAMYLSRELTHHSLPVIGHWFHRHHTTVLHAVRSVESRRIGSESFSRELNTIRKRLLP